MPRVGPRPLYLILIILCSAVVPLQGFMTYRRRLQIVEHHDLYTFWLAPDWSPLLYASSMYQWGGMLGIFIGLFVWRKGLPSKKGHLLGVLKLVTLSLVFTIIGVLVWFVLCLTYYSSIRINLAPSLIVYRDLLAYAAIYQYVLFWAILSYGMMFIFRHRLLTALSLTGIQLFELFWVLKYYPAFEMVLPTAISRLPVALSYPVWRSDTWAAAYPSLLASSPMTLTSTYRIVDVHLLWILLIESVYLGIIACIIIYDLIRKGKHYEVVSTCKP